MRVWIDQDLCTGDGLCTDHCPEMFMLLEDGLSYVRDPLGHPLNDPGCRASITIVPPRLVERTVAAALDCPGECIFLEDDDDEHDDELHDETDVADAVVIDPVGDD